MASGNVSILDGNTFVVSDRRGDVEGGPGDESGLFHNDMRFVSRWVLTVNGVKPNVLSIDDFQYNCVQFFCAVTTGTIYVDSHLSVTRQREITKEGFSEQITLENHSHDPMDIAVELEAAADFADLFEVKDKLEKKGELYSRVEDGRLVLGYRRERFNRETWIDATEGAMLAERGLSFRVRLDAHQSWTTKIDVRAVDSVRRVREGRSSAFESSTRAEGVDKWMEGAPTLISSSRSLEATYRRSLLDLAALRFLSPLTPGNVMPAAGLPWFMAMFGRDSLITSYQALPFVPELARTTLLTLAALQARVTDDFRDAEPGKILHELRLGEMTAFEERPHSPYYGGADSTPLFLVLLDEYHRWSGDDEFVRSLEREARRAVRWIDEHGDRDHDGYIEYERRQETGLDNQCWKDSWDSIAFSNGEIAPTPRATCELQGYAYDAKVRVARLARELFGDEAWAAKLEREAEELKRRFNRDFWIADRQFFALALDGRKRQVDSLTSNIGHLLWSGIVDPEKADACARHLMGPALFSGWGVRTMADGEGSYNPIGYHVGTVWPHDSSIVAWGLRRYGYRNEAARVGRAVLEAADFSEIAFRKRSRVIRGTRRASPSNTRRHVHPRPGRAERRS